MKTKRLLLIILGVLIVLSPTIALAGCYFYSGSVQSEVMSATIVDNLGNTVDCKEGDPLFDIFKAMFGKNGKNRPDSLTALPEEALSFVRYAVTYLDSFNVESSYMYYFSADAGKCYYTDGENHPYRISKASAEAFLNSDFSESVYSTAFPPTVKIGKISLAPYTVDWSYKTVGGVLKKSSASYSDRNETTVLESFLSGLALDFSVEPDEITLRITDKKSGDSVYSGSYAGLTALTFDGSRDVSVDMTAVWNNLENRGYNGVMKYFFEGRMFGRSAFKLSASSAKCGDVVILNAYNIIDPSEITVVTDPQLSFTPQFYKVGDFWQALVPIAVDAVESNTTVSFTVSSSSATDILLLNVAPLPKKEYNYSSKTMKDYYTESVLKSLRENMASVALEASSFSFNGGKFVIPTEGNYYSETSNYDFGTKVNLHDVGESFIALDHMYCANMGAVTDGKVGEGKSTSVLAAFDGKVVYVGSQTYTGRLVVIDHGSGLKTWYSNLSSDIAVKVGDTVTAGQFISHAADGGLNADNNFNFHVGVTVNGVPVDIQPLIDRGLIFKD